MAFNKAKALQEAEKSVSQGKIALAIKVYLHVFEKDPADLAILNTVGDLYVRDKNLPEALRYFHRLADSYTQEGFTLKAIAIYKKISKLDPSSVEVLVKTGELYTIQGLGREAREQYLQAVEFYKKKNQTEKVLDVFRKIVALDPENGVYRMRMGDFCEQAGKKAEAVEAYVATAESALRRNDVATAETALKKAAAIEGKDSQIQILRARVALSKHEADAAVKLLTSDPELKSNPVARQILLDTYLEARNFGEAEDLVLKAYRETPADFSPLSVFAGLCVGGGNYDAVINLLRGVFDSVIEQKHAGGMMEILRQIWGKNPQYLPALELVRELCEKTNDETGLPEVLEALGNAYVQIDQLEKAEEVFRKLSDREPENESVKTLLNQVLEKEHKGTGAPVAAEIQKAELAMSAEPEPAAQAASIGAEEAELVKEALENSDLFSRYGLQDKAIAELEKVLEVFPNQAEIHRRILEVAQKTSPARVAQAAEALARIHTERGESDLAEKYELIVAKGGKIPVTAIPEEPAPPPEPPPPEPSLRAEAAEFDLSAGLPSEVSTEEPAGAIPSPPPQPAAGHIEEFDLSGDWKPAIQEEGSAPIHEPLLTPEPSAAAEPTQEAPTEALPAGEVAAPEPVEAEPELTAPPFNVEESRVEVEFYLDQGFVDEARKTVAGLEEKHPGNPQVAELRQLVDLRVTSEPATEETRQPAPAGKSAEWEMPESFAQREAEGTPVVNEASPAGPPPPVPGEVKAEPAPAIADAANPLGGLIGDLESGLEGIEVAPPPQPAPAGQPNAREAPASAGASALSSLLDEMGGDKDTEGGAGDSQTHYDLGVAFREMNLLDEAIGEFQKVAREARKGKYPPHFLQACTLLALCFMDKKMPALATKWYSRALEMPDLDEDAILALQYDLGVAYEQAGNTSVAIEKFSEVYSQNIDYRDVAEKLRLLQQKP